MAILFSQADGSDQHYDTYEEFEQAMILMKRLNGEEVPQDLLDEAKSKHGDKEPKPFQVQIDGNNFESAISEATRELAEALDEVSGNRTPVSDECENPEKEPKFKVGDKIKVVKNTSSGHVNGTIGEIVVVEYFESENKWTYVVHPISDYLFEQSLRHEESDLGLFNDDIEVGDKVRVISAKDGTSVTFHKFDMGSIVEVEEVYGNGRIEAYDGVLYQTLLHHHYEKVEPLGKDANGEDLFKGDVVTGTEDNDYGYTNSTVDMEVLGEGSSFIDEKANIRVRIVGESNTYGVDSSKFVKLSDGLTEDLDSEEEFKVGDKVRVVGNRARHDVEEGEIREITKVDYEEPKYNLSEYSGGSWAHSEDIEIVEEEPKFKVGDRVKVVNNLSGGHPEGTVGVIERMNCDDGTFDYEVDSEHGSPYNYTMYHGEVELEHSEETPTEFRTGDVVKVTESFVDILGGRVTCGAVYNYDESLEYGKPFVGTVYLGDNHDKIELVCRAQDRLDKY